MTEVMNIAIKTTNLNGVKLIKPATVFEDFRGDYVEIYNKELYVNAGIDTDFVQDDYATSKKHVLRGIHGDNKTTKLVKCVYGSLYLVVVNNDPDSKQYKEWESFEITSKNRLQVLVPAKFGIGYLVLSDIAIFHYKQSTYYHETNQFTLKWNDEKLNIKWPVVDTIRSDRDS